MALVNKITTGSELQREFAAYDRGDSFCSESYNALDDVENEVSDSHSYIKVRDNCFLVGG
jgi:hypothetical protein